MFGLGMPEILLILAVALLVIGPKKLPELAKTLGRALGEFKNAAQDFKKSIDLEDSVGELNDPVKTIKNDLKDTLNPLHTPSEPENGKKESTLAKESGEVQSHDKVTIEKDPGASDSHSNGGMDEQERGKVDGDNLHEEGKAEK